MARYRDHTECLVDLVEFATLLILLLCCLAGLTDLATLLILMILLPCCLADLSTLLPCFPNQKILKFS